MSAPRELTTWVSTDMYIARGGPAATPFVRTSHPAFRSRATLSATKLAIAPPDTRIPPAVGGSPNCEANHRMRCCSISDAEGESIHPPRFMLRPAASRSAAAPGTVPAPVMYPANRGCPGYIDQSNTTSRR